MKDKMLIFVIVGIVFFLAGCAEEPEDYSVGKITIINIPADIAMDGNSSATSPAFRVYLNASNSMSPDDPPATKGVAHLGDENCANCSSVKTGSTWTVTMQLLKPNPDPQTDNDPSLDTGSWSGTANYFSIMISPENLNGNGVDAVWAKGSYTLNKGKAQIDWNKLMDFRDPALADMGLGIKTLALYNDIILNDPDIVQ